MVGRDIQHVSNRACMHQWDLHYFTLQLESVIHMITWARDPKHVITGCQVACGIMYHHLPLAGAERMRCDASVGTRWHIAMAGVMRLFVLLTFGSALRMCELRYGVSRFISPFIRDSDLHNLSRPVSYDRTLHCSSFP